MFIHFEPSLVSKDWEYKNFRLLVAIPSPRNIPEVANAVDDYLSDQFDVAWFKFYPQVAEPYHKIRSYFLSRKKYTHLAILPDDLVINEGVYKVIDLAQRWPDRYRVAMGNCNFEYNSNGKLACGQDGSPFCAFTHTLPALERVRRKYTWYTVKEVKKFKGQPIRVLHCGTSFAILRRDVVEAVTLDTDQAWNKNDSVGTSEDVVLSWDLHKLKIPIYVHTGVMFKHLRGLKIAELVQRP